MDSNNDLGLGIERVKAHFCQAGLQLRTDPGLVQLANSVFFRHWITIGFECDHDPELSAVISLGGRISANHDVTIKTKTNFGNILV